MMPDGQNGESQKSGAASFPAPASDPLSRVSWENKWTAGKCLNGGDEFGLIKEVDSQNSSIVTFQTD
jgi:hypothetical protein